MTVGSRELVHQNCEAKALYERVEAEEATTFILTHGGNRKRHFTFEPSHALLAAEHAQSAIGQMFLNPTNPILFSEMAEVRIQTWMPKSGSYCRSLASTATAIAEMHNALGLADAMKHVHEGFLAAETIVNGVGASPQAPSRKLPPLRLVYETIVKKPDGTRQIGYRASGSMKGMQSIGQTGDEICANFSSLAIEDVKAHMYPGWWNNLKETMVTPDSFVKEDHQYQTMAGEIPVVSFQDRDY